LLNDGNDGDTLFEGNSNFQIGGNDKKAYLLSIKKYLESIIKKVDNSQKIKTWYLKDTGERKLSNTCSEKKPTVGDVTTEELRKLVVANGIYILEVLNRIIGVMCERQVSL
jgi:hypothetical protein